MIVVFGAQGQLGRALQDAIGEAPEHVFLSRDSHDYCGDITNTAGITETLMELRPEIILNAAAYTAVDQAESEPDLAQAVNAQAPAVIAQIAAKLNSLLVHYSTDYVFDGRGDSPWRETDACNPASVYGKSKRAGEETVMAANGRYYILRSSWIYGLHGNNFLKTMLRLSESKEEIQVVNDQFGVPTPAEYLANSTLDLINLATPGFGSKNSAAPAYGIYHCAPAGVTSWFEYARLVINTAKSHGAAKLCKKITPISTAQYPTAAVRPHNSRLDTHKLAAVLGVAPPDWQEDVIITVGRLLNEAPEDDTYDKS